MSTSTSALLGKRFDKNETAPSSCSYVNGVVQTMVWFAMLSFVPRQYKCRYSMYVSYILEQWPLIICMHVLLKDVPRHMGGKSQCYDIVVYIMISLTIAGNVQSNWIQQPI